MVLPSLSANTWYDVMIRIKTSEGADGLTQVYARRAGQAWLTMPSWQNAGPSLPYVPGGLDPKIPKKIDTYQPGAGANLTGLYVTTGLYTGSNTWAQSTSQVYAYIDQLRRYTDFASAKAGFPETSMVQGAGQITGIGGKCVDVAGSHTANGTAVQLYRCNGTGAQSWTVGKAGTLRALGKCMDVTGSGTTNGTKVQLYSCNGTGAQVWQPQGAGTLRNPHSGKCLDATGGNFTDRTRFIIYTCTGTSNQLWKLK